MLHCYLYISAKLGANWNNLALKIQIRCDVCSTVQCILSTFILLKKVLKSCHFSGAQVQFETWKTKKSTLGQISK